MNKNMWVKGFEAAKEDSKTMGRKYAMHIRDLMLKASGIDEDFQNGYQGYFELVIE